MAKVGVDVLGDATGLKVALGESEASLVKFGSQYKTTFDGMTTAALELKVAQDKLAISTVRFGEGTTGAAEAALAYRRTIDRLAVSQTEASRSTISMGGAFSHLSTLLIGGTGVAFALHAVVGAAEQHQVAMTQQKNVIDRLGLSYTENAGRIAEIVKAQGDLGYSESATTTALTLALRATGNVTDAYRLLGVATNIARGTGRDLSTVIFSTVKAFDGQTGALRRLVPGLTAGAKGWQIIDEAGQKYAGAAVSYADTAAGAQARLEVAIHRTEVTIGTALLPTVSTLATRLAAWADKSGQQERIQQDVNEALGVAKTLVGGLSDAIHAFTPIVRGVDEVTGGFAHTLEILIGLKFASVAYGWAAGIAKIGSAAAVAEGETAALGGSLAGLASMGPIAIPIALVFAGSELGKIVNGSGFDKAVGSAFDSAGLTNEPHFTSRQQVVDYIAKHGDGSGLLHKLLRTLPGGGKGKPSDFRVSGNDARTALGGDVGRGADIGNSATAVSALTKAQQLALGLAANPNDMALLRQKQAVDNAGIAWLNQRRAQGKITNEQYVKAITQLYNDRASTEATIQSLTAAQVTAAKKAAKDNKQHFVIPMQLLVAQAKAGTTSGTGDDMAAAKAIRKFAEWDIKTKKLTGQALIDAYNAIAAADATLGQTSTAHAGHVMRLTSSRDIIRGLHLSKAQALAVESRFAQSQAHHGHVPLVAGVMGQPVVIHVYGGGDRPEVVARKVAAELDKRTRGHVSQRRGHTAGTRPH